MKHIKSLIQSLVILAVLVGIPVIFEVQYQCDKEMNYPVGSEDEYQKSLEKYRSDKPKSAKWIIETPPVSPNMGEYKHVDK